MPSRSRARRRAVPDRILVVLASAQRRGAEIQGESLARSLVGAGYRCDVVALTEGASERLLDVPVLGVSPLSLRTLLALRRRLRGALVIAHGSTTLPAVALASLGLGCVWWYRSIGEPAAWVRGRLHRWRTGFLIRRATGVVALWAGAADQISRLYRVDPKRVSVIANDRDPGDFSPADPARRERARASLGLTGPTVLFCGSLSEEKRPADAVEVVSGLEGVVLLVAGEGPLEESLRRLASQPALNGRVRVVGAVDDVRGLLDAADLVLVTSRTEGMPGIIIEALLSGLAVVATDVGAVRSMVASESQARCCPVGDIAALRSTVGELLAGGSDPAARGSTRRASPAAIEQFDSARVLERWVGLVSAVGVEPVRPRTDR